MNRPAATLTDSSPFGANVPFAPTTSTSTRAVDVLGFRSRQGAGARSGRCARPRPARASARRSAPAPRCPGRRPSTCRGRPTASDPRRRSTRTASSASPAARSRRSTRRTVNGSTTMPSASTASILPWGPQNETSATAGDDDRLVSTKVVRCFAPEPTPRYQLSSTVGGHEPTTSPPPRALRGGLAEEAHGARSPAASGPSRRRRRRPCRDASGSRRRGSRPVHGRAGSRRSRTCPRRPVPPTPTPRCRPGSA